MVQAGGRNWTYVNPKEIAGRGVVLDLYADFLIMDNQVRVILNTIAYGYISHSSVKEKCSMYNTDA